jgi:DNA-binding XRE family transcriptional regulator
MPIAQFTANGQDFVVAPRTEYEALLQRVEDAEDEAAMAEFRAAKARGEALTMPRDQWARIRAGESPLRVIREYRGLTQAELGVAAGVEQAQISVIESGKRAGSVATLKSLAKALGAPVDQLTGG